MPGFKKKLLKNSPPLKQRGINVGGRGAVKHVSFIGRIEQEFLEEDTNASKAPGQRLKGKNVKKPDASKGGARRWGSAI